MLNYLGMLEVWVGRGGVHPSQIFAPPLLLDPSDFWPPRYNWPPQIFRPRNIPELFMSIDTANKD